MQNDSYQFRSIYGSHHVVYPHDKGYVIKRILKSGARSATEQYEIHRIACDFKHNLIRVPRIGTLFDAKSYSMEQIFEYHKVHIILIALYPALKEALSAYHDYMKSHGYFPYGYTLLQSEAKFIIIDFSQYGSMQTDRVYFKHLKNTIPLSEAQEYYDITCKTIVFLEDNANEDRI